jgi:hypothetical protein
MKKTKALEGVIHRLKNRPSNSSEEIEASEFVDGEKFWGHWQNNRRSNFDDSSPSIPPHST